MENVVVGDAEISPDSGEGAVELGGFFPPGDGFFVAAFVVEEVAEVVGGAGVFGVFGDGRQQDGDFFEAVREAVVARLPRGGEAGFLGGGGVPCFVVEVGEVIRLQRAKLEPGDARELVIGESPAGG